MSIQKNKKIKFVIVILITVISLIEIYFGFKIYNEYKGVYQTEIFFIFILQPYLYIVLLNKQIKYLKARSVLVVGVSIILPFIICFSLPKYTYDEGKLIVKNKIKTGINITYTKQPIYKYSVPIVENNKNLLIRNREYYYKIKVNSAINYYIVSPITGKITKLSECYWK
jgi:hypothetical protein